jgi:hypothetical protein
VDKKVSYSAKAVTEAAPTELASGTASTSAAEALDSAGPIAVVSSNDRLKIIAEPPGWRRPIVAQLFGVTAAAAISSFWLRSYPLWLVAAVIFWLVMAARVRALALHQTTLLVDRDSITIDTRGWFGDQSRRAEVSPHTTVSVKRDAAHMTIDLFPADYLEIQGTNGLFKALHSYDPQVIELVRQRIVAWLQATVLSA